MGGQTLSLLNSDEPPGKAWSCLDRVYNTPWSPIRVGGARSAHRGEDISIEAFDGHWPAPISRVRRSRPCRGPGTSGGRARGSLLTPLLLALFLLPYPHQLHTSSLPADDHCKGAGREGSQRPTCAICTLPTQGLQAPRFPLCVTSPLFVPSILPPRWDCH